ncbi:golgin candidate 4-like isoform X1 [Camellia sinensis]|uniref:golgin candidate 4-like isoform X1 n=1 Tax=Camellia sinensis TaxID=4442 RepID=UPI0010355ADA|nr:golgin candidate 4-like isoform X1 [Camellia sinensis]
MMWSTIANLKENLNKIALDVHDDDDDDEQGIEIYNSPDRTRLSRNFSHSSPASRSPLANGFDSHHNSEIEQYKAQIKRLQESEAEIKVLSVNYAALLKEKEDWISRLNEENGLLKQNLDATNATLNASRNESLKTSTNSLNGLKGSSDHSPNRQYKAIVKNRPIGNQSNNGFVSKQDGLCNGIQGNEKEDPADLLEQKNRSLAVIQADLESQIKKLGLELEKERGKLANIHLQLQDEQKLNGSFQDELNLLKVDKDKSTIEMKKIRDVLNEKISEVRRLQMELNRRDNIEADDTAEGLKRVIAALEKENNSLKMAKVELETSLKAANENSNKQSTSLSEVVCYSFGNFVSVQNVQSLGSFPGKEEMELSLQKLEKDLKETGQQRDKALQELSRLKKHLLDKEIEESEKMDEDSKIIEELKEKNEYQRLQILHLEKALKQAIAGQEEVKMINNNELQKYKEIIDDLNRKLTSCMSTIDAKNVELLNLQTALGSYYAELEAKEHLEGDLAHAREESAKLAELLKDAHQKAEISRKEKEDILEKLSQSERILAEGRNRVNKLEEDNAKLRRALEQSMSRLNRMSMDSDYFVDRRIVIKLLVTYFQRNHSKEVLDLMVRMLGFSDEDKQRIGVAQQGGKGVVRGVLGLPGRLVGGFLGGSSAEANQNMASENQSFADLWVDFLLKETEERERRESAEANASKEDQQKRSPNDMGSASPVPDQRTNATTAAFSNLSPSLNQNRSPLPSRGNILQSEHSDSEFSTVPLTSSERASQFSRRY